jgi:hypothetical protein
MKSDWMNDRPVAAPKRFKWRARLMWPLAGTAALALVGAGVLFASDPSRVFALKAGSGAGGLLESSPSGLLGAAALDPNDPALRFSQTHVGQVLFTTANSDKCRRVLFDNRSGTSYWVNAVDCGRPVEQAQVSEKPDRLLAIKNSFKR